MYIGQSRSNAAVGLESPRMIQLDMFLENAADGVSGGPQVAPAGVDEPTVAPGHDQAQGMAHDGSASGVSTRPPIFMKKDFDEIEKKLIERLRFIGSNYLFDLLGY